MADKKLFLLDGHALVYRAHYSFITRPLYNSKGMNVSAITGFVRALWDIIQNQKPTHIAVAFDLKGPTFRHEMYDLYKANRDAQPEDITLAFPYIEDIVKGFNIPIKTLVGYEADDVIGTIAKKAEKEGFEVYMMTPDKDYAQLVSDKIFMYKPGRKGGDVEILGEKEILEKWNLQRVDQVADILGLQGDAVDNIPGIPGVGPKTATTLINKYGTVENIIAHAHELKGKLRERVEENKEQGLLSKQLAIIKTDLDVEFDAEDFKLVPLNKEVISGIFKELEFRRLAQTILGESAPPVVGSQGNLFGSSTPPPKSSFARPEPAAIAAKNITNVDHTYHLVSDEKGMKDLAVLLNKQTEFAFDTETTGIDANNAELVGLSFSIKHHEGYYVPVPKDRKEAQAVVEIFRAALENEKIAKIGQNLKYDLLMLKWYDVEVGGYLIDTMLIHYLLEPDLRHNMDYLAETYLGYSPVSIKNLIGSGKNQLSMRDVSIEKAGEYAAEDADITLQLKTELFPKLKENEVLELYKTIEEPLIRVLVDMEYAGINLNAEFLNEFGKELEEEIITHENAVYESAGSRFNISSPKQVGEVLFDRLEIPYRWRKTKSGQYSTNEEKLTELGPKHEVVQKILDYRSLTKLKSTYVDALPRMVNPKTGRVHSSFNQALASTGRLSSNNPNLQNIPIKTEKGRKVRKAFIPRDENHILIAADYSQIELRLIAELSGDEAMVEAFQQGADIHRATASNVYKVQMEEVTDDQRRNAKTVNFSIVYGAGSTNLSKNLGITRKEAKELIGSYYAEYSGLKVYMDKTVEFARQNGYVTTLMGRRRYLRDIDSRNSMARAGSERTAINSPIQGTAADLIKIAMINIRAVFKEKGFKTRMILQVHDELIFDVPKEEVKMVKPIIEDLMKNAMPNLKVPILVGMGEGQDWLEAH